MERVKKSKCKTMTQKKEYKYSDIMFGIFFYISMKKKMKFMNPITKNSRDLLVYLSFALPFLSFNIYN